MDPNVVTSADWAQLWDLLHFLWLTLLFVVGFAGNLLLALAVIPSQVHSGHLPAGALRLRPLLLLLALVALVGVALSLATAVSQAEVVGRIYPKWFF